MKKIQLKVISLILNFLLLNILVTEGFFPVFLYAQENSFTKKHIDIDKIWLLPKGTTNWQKEKKQKEEKIPVSQPVILPYPPSTSLETPPLETPPKILPSQPSPITEQPTNKPSDTLLPQSPPIPTPPSEPPSIEESSTQGTTDRHGVLSLPSTQETQGTQPTQRTQETQISPAQQRQPKEQKIKIKGYRYLKLKTYASSGNKDRFLAQEGLITLGENMEQGTDLSIDAAIVKKIKFTGKYSELPNQQRQFDFNVDLGSEKNKIRLGDISVNFPGGSFSPLSKRITGMEFINKSKKLESYALMSQSKSTSKGETFNGKNIKGPYQLRVSDIVEGSEIVKKNGIIIPKDEYIFNPFQGDIVFQDVLNPTDIIEITYEQKLNLALSEGNLMGFSTSYKTDKLELGGAYLLQESSKSLQRLKETSVDKQMIYSYSTDTNIAMLKVNDDNRPIFMVKNFETIKKINTKTNSIVALTKNIDYTVSDYGYYTGTFILTQKPDSSDVSYLITYSYYIKNVINDFRGLSSEAIYKPDFGGKYYLKKAATIYKGSEQVWRCNINDQNSLNVCTQIPAKDYEINERDNSITFTDISYFNTPYFVRIEYSTVPLQGSDSSQFNHTVTSFKTNWKQSEKFNIDAEMATSNSDISSKRIHKTKIFPAALLDTICPPTQVLIPNPCDFTVGDQKLIENSDKVYFNDNKNPSSQKNRYSQYTIDYDVGKVSFKENVPKGTVVIVEYDFTPPIQGVVSGTVWKLSPSLNLKKLALKTSITKSDTTFASIGSENTLSTSRRESSLNYKFNDAISIGYNSNSFETAFDIMEIETQTTNQNTLNFSYSGKLLKTVTMTMGNQSVSDNKNPKQTDNTQKSKSITVANDIPLLKNASFNLSLQTQDNTDNTMKTANSNTKLQKIGVTYSPSEKISVNFSNSTNKINTLGLGAATATTNTNTSQNIDFNLIPIPLLVVNFKIDKQTTKDSNSAIPPTEVNTSNISITSKPFWKITNSSLTFSREDRPAGNTPGTKTQSRIFNFSLKITNLLYLSPSLTNTKTSLGDTSSSNNDTTSYRLEYRPPGKPYYSTLTLDNSKRTTTSKNSASTTDTAKKIFDFSYSPQQKKYSIGYRFDTDTNKTTSAEKSDSYSSQTSTLKSTYKFSQKASLNFNLTMQKRSGAIATAYDTYLFDYARQISKLLKWNASYKIVKNTDAEGASKNYQGTIMESLLRLEF